MCPAPAWKVRLTFLESPLLLDEDLAAINTRGQPVTVPRAGWLSVPMAAYSAHATDTAVVLPAHIEGQECLEFLGFASAVIHPLFRRFSRGRVKHGDFADMIVYAEAQLQTAAPGPGGGWPDEEHGTPDAWDAALQAAGVGEPLRRRVLAPGFDVFRQRQTPRQCVMDMMRATFYFLMFLNRHVGQPENRLGAKLPIVRHLPSVRRASSPSSPPSSLALSHDVLAPSFQRVALLPSNAGGQAEELLLGSETAADGFIVLYKAVLLHDVSSAIAADGTPDLRHLRDSQQLHTDLGGMDGSCVLVQQREAALLKARWLSQLQPAAGLMPVGIVALVLPRDALQDAVAFDAADDAWKQFVWAKRTGEVVPDTLQRYKDADILIGPARANGWIMLDGGTASWHEQTAWTLDDGRTVMHVTLKESSLERVSARGRCVVELV